MREVALQMAVLGLRPQRWRHVNRLKGEELRPHLAC